MEKYKEENLRRRKNNKFLIKQKSARTFLIILSIVSILGFFQIMIKSLFDYDLLLYVEAFWMMILGTGFLLEGRITELYKIKRQGLTSKNFTKMVTVIIGIVAVISGIFSLPQFRVSNPGFLAVKGILSLMAIIVIVTETWVLKK
jgi:uncharacterized membrane protein